MPWISGPENKQQSCLHEIAIFNYAIVSAQFHEVSIEPFRIRLAYLLIFCEQNLLLVAMYNLVEQLVQENPLRIRAQTRGRKEHHSR